MEEYYKIMNPLNKVEAIDKHKLEDKIKEVVAKHLHFVNLFADDRERLETDITDRESYLDRRTS